MTDIASAATKFGPVTTTRDESVAKRPDETAAGEPSSEEKPERAREIVFQLSDVEVKYSGVTAVQDVNVDIAANEITAFIGPSGCGKTTVLRSLNRMHDITPGAEVLGKVTYHGEDLYGSKVDPADEAQRGRGAGGGGADPGRALGRGARQVANERAGALRWSAAASVHRSLPRRPA